MNDKTLVERLRNVNDADLWGDKTCQIVDAAFETVPRNPNDHDEAVAYRRAITALQSRIDALEAENAQMRRQGQDEGFAAAVQELRDMSARKPLPTLWHAASALADSLEQSRIPCQALEGE